MRISVRLITFSVNHSLYLRCRVRPQNIREEVHALLWLIASSAARVVYEKNIVAGCAVCVIIPNVGFLSVSKRMERFINKLAAPNGKSHIIQIG